jgi:hypothetical protein
MLKHIWKVLRIQVIVDGGRKVMALGFLVWVEVFASVGLHNARIDEGRFARLAGDFAGKEVGGVFAEEEEDLGDAFAEVERGGENSY